MPQNNWDITEVWQQVETGKTYNNKVNYYATVDENISYVMGDQWRGVKSNGLPMPVFNVIKRVRDYKVAAIMSSKIKATYNLENISTNTEDETELEQKALVDIMTNYSEIKWEKEKMDSKIRECLMDGFTTGDYGIFTYWDYSKETGQDAKGDFCCEVIDGVNVLFGNPNTREVEKQPYIILLGRDMVKNLQEEARRNKVPEEDVLKISADEDTEYTAGEYGKKELDKKGETNGKCTYAIKLYRENGTIFYTKSTKFCEIRKKIDMQIKKYPFAWGNWEQVKNSYHGRAECTGMLPNQRYINKQFSMLMTWMMFNALGKTAYDSTRISSWSNQIGVAIPVDGDLTGAIQQIPAGNFNSGVLELTNITMKETMNALGVNDVVMGDVNPTNTSAIIAVQKQSAVPLENVQANLYQFVEDVFLIWAEFIKSKYTADRLLPQKQDNETVYTNFNSTPIQDKLMNVKIDVGPSSYWSEITAMQTLDGLLKGNYITLLQYLERIPNGIIIKKQELIEELQQQVMQQQQQMQMNSQNNMNNNLMPQSEDKTEQYEQMARILEQLPPDMQDEFMNLSPEEQEKAIEEFMGGGMNGQM